MNETQIFEKVVHHLGKQGVPAKEGVGACKYRTSDGLMCAVGCLITDEAYDPEIETHGVFYGGVYKVLEASGIVVDQRLEKILSALQTIHDTVQPSDWARNLKELTVEHGIIYDPTIFDQYEVYKS